MSTFKLWTINSKCQNCSNRTYIRCWCAVYVALYWHSWKGCHFLTHPMELRVPSRCIPAGGNLTVPLVATADETASRGHRWHGPP